MLRTGTGFRLVGYRYTGTNRYRCVTGLKRDRNWTGTGLTPVHSLATMISLKMEIPEDAWEDDPNGITLANCVNSSLPENIKVFGILPSKKLDSVSYF
ncbi:hypothetical protein T459_23308 [Capsicum annuum]|uniref:Uncharacterized protein n=1 Tax=Capsicum annuum TaxID=4072 RepID=A0A2G2YS03_CAPAN|nr:hypothetical protein T459_23308 [Capsicum annuum]